MESLSNFECDHLDPVPLETGAWLCRPVFEARAGYNLGAKYYDDWKWQRIWGKVEWPFIDSILTGIGTELARSPLILDVGAGTGAYLQHIKTTFDFGKSCGIDVSGRMLAMAKSKLRGQAILELGDARKLQFPDASFDVVLLCRVASHLEEIHTAAREIYRVLRCGGLLVVSDIDPRHPYECTRIPFGAKKISIETYKHSIDDWTEAANQLGFLVRKQTVIWSYHVRQADVPNVPSSLLNSSNHPVSFILCTQKVDS